MDKFIINKPDHWGSQLSNVSSLGFEINDFGIRAQCSLLSLSICCRFDGGAGKAMANSCVPYGRCGTSQTGWFDGHLPNVEDDIQPGAVCFNDGSGGCCSSRLERDIFVRNCGGFYVYKLPSSTNGCFKAYCGDGK